MGSISPPRRLIAPRHVGDTGAWAALPSAGGALLALGVGTFLIVLDPIQGALGVGLLVISLATLVEPLVGLGVGLALGLLRAYLHTEVPQVPAQIGQVFLVLAVGVWVARGLATRQVRIRRSPMLLPLLVFSGVALVSIVDSAGAASFGVPELLKWLQIVLVFLFVSEHLDRRRLPWLVAGLVTIGLFQAAVGTWQFGIRGEGPDHFAILDGSYYRAYGTFEQPNPYGGYLGLTLSLAIGVLAGALSDALHSRWRARPLARLRLAARGDWLSTSVFLALAAAVLALAAALGMSWSRGAWVGFAAAAAAIAIALPRRPIAGALLVGVLACSLAGLYVAGLLPASVTSRLTSFTQYVRFQDVRGVAINDANYSIVERFAHWQAALEMLRTNVWLGVGFGTYEAAYRNYALLNWPYALGHAHNYYLTVSAETGLVGLASYVALWVVVFWQTVRAVQRGRGLARGAAIGLLGAWTHLSVHSLLDNLYVNNVHAQIGVMLGILGFLLRASQAEGRA